MITASGVIVLPTNNGVPRLSDIAISLARLPRFGGHCRRRWTVAHHSLACAEMARTLERVPDSRLQLHLLLHDAHESVTGDVTRHWKTKQVKAQQEELDERIYHFYELPRPTPEEKIRIKEIDDQAMIAEGYFLGPSGIIEFYLEEGRPKPQPWATEAVELIAGDYHDEAYTESYLALAYLTPMEYLINEWKYSRGPRLRQP